MSEKNNKKKKKNSQMIIRINDEERAQFIELCEALEKLGASSASSSKNTMGSKCCYWQ